MGKRSAVLTLWSRMRDAAGIVLSLFALSGCAHVSSNSSWKNLYYSTGQFEVRLRERPLSDCVLATGERDLIKRLKAVSDVGLGQFLVERLPQPPSPGALKNSVVIQHQYVLVQGVPVQPQCDAPYMYWLHDFRVVQALR